MLKLSVSIMSLLGILGRWLGRVGLLFLTTICVGISGMSAIYNNIIVRGFVQSEYFRFLFLSTYTSSTLRSLHFFGKLFFLGLLCAGLILDFVYSIILQMAGFILFGIPAVFLASLALLFVLAFPLALVGYPAFKGFEYLWPDGMEYPVTVILSFDIHGNIIDNPLGDLIHLHHDILFFTFFILTFVVWMVGTICICFNQKRVVEFSTHSRTSDHNVVLAPTSTRDVWLKYIFYCAGIVLTLVLFSGNESAIAGGNGVAPEPEVIPEGTQKPQPETLLPVDPRTNVEGLEEMRTLTKSIQHFFKVGVLKPKPALQLFQYTVYHADTFHEMAKTKYDALQPIRDLFNRNAFAYPAFKNYTIEYGSLGPAMSESPHFVTLWDETGHLPCKFKKTTKGSPDLLVGERLQYKVQAKTKFGLTEMGKWYLDKIAGTNRRVDINSISIIVPTAPALVELESNIQLQLSSDFKFKFLRSSSTIRPELAEVYFDKVQQSFPNGQAYDNWVNEVNAQCEQEHKQLLYDARREASAAKARWAAINKYDYYFVAVPKDDTLVGHVDDLLPKK